MESERAACSHTTGSQPLHLRETQAGFALCFSSVITGFPAGETLLNTTTFPLFKIVVLIKQPPGKRKSFLGRAVRGLPFPRKTWQSLCSANSSDELIVLPNKPSTKRQK